MRRGFDRHAFDKALSEFRFEEAERLLDDADPGLREELLADMRRRRGEATARAQDLYRRIVDLGSAGDHEQVVALDRDPTTAPLLAVLPESGRRHAGAYLGAAARWEASKRQTHQRRLAEARKSLEAFDLELARGLVRRIDRRFLDDEGAVALDRLVLDIEARAMEMESFQRAEQRVTQRSQLERRPWWRRRKG